MSTFRTSLVAATLAVLAACGGGGSDDPGATETTVSQDQIPGLSDAIDRTRQVAEQAENRANLIDDLAPSE